MFKYLIRNKKGQNTAEYAILISLVVASIVAMQTYVQRALNARTRDASTYLTNIGGNVIGATAQYEPYYQNTDYRVETVSTDSETLGNGVSEWEKDSIRNRTGSSTTGYDASLFGLDNEFTTEDLSESSSTNTNSGGI